MILCLDLNMEVKIKIPCQPKVVCVWLNTVYDASLFNVRQVVCIRVSTNQHLSLGI